MNTSDRRRHGFSFTRWRSVVLSGESAFAEILVGLWLIFTRGLMLLDSGFAFPRVTALVYGLGLTADLVGTTLVLCGLAQVVGAGTYYYIGRAALAFVAAVVCMFMWVACLGSDLGHTTIAWTWAGLALCEVSLAWRVLLYQVVVKDRLAHRP